MPSSLTRRIILSAFVFVFVCLLRLRMSQELFAQSVVVVNIDKTPFVEPRRSDGMVNADRTLYAIIEYRQVFVMYCNDFLRT